MDSDSAIDSDVDCYCIVPIQIGANCTISRGAFLCTGSHDITHPRMPLVAKPITIHENAWICARSFIGPGVTVHNGAVVAACAVVTKDVESWTVVGGNPATKLKSRQINEVV